MSWYSIYQHARNQAIIAQGDAMLKKSEEEKNTIRVSDVSFKSMRSAQALTLSPTELVAMCATGMNGFDQEIARKTAEQRKNVATLGKLNTLKAQMAKHSEGLDKDGDEKRGGGDSDRGKLIREKDFRELNAAYQEAMKTLPPEYADIAAKNNQTMYEGDERFQFNKDQASRMSEEIDGAINDIQTKQQAEMAEINNLVSKRSNMIEMTKNLTTALAGQQDFITKNAPR